MTIEPYDHLFLAGVYGLMLIIRLIYGWQANRKGGKAVRRREPGWSPILMGILMFLSNGIVMVNILWPSAIQATSIALSEGWRWLGLVDPPNPGQELGGGGPGEGKPLSRYCRALPLGAPPYVHHSVRF